MLIHFVILFHMEMPSRQLYQYNNEIILSDNDEIQQIA